MSHNLATKRITDMPGMNFLWQVDNLYLAGQPAPESLEHIKNLGIKKVFNLRAPGEMDFSWEVNGLKELGIDYEQLPILDATAHLDPLNCKKLSDQMSEDTPQFIHCGSANRVAGWLITYLVLYRGLGLEAAVEIAHHNGLSSTALVDQAISIIEKAQA